MRFAKHFLPLLFPMALAPAAQACSFAFTGLPYDPGDYVFYGRVLEHISHRMDACGRDPKRTGDQCPAAWGWRIEVVEPVNLPKPLKQVEYFEYTVDAACGALPLGEVHVRRAPMGSLITLVARPHWSSAPGAASPRLSSPIPVNGLLAVLPAGSNPRALARAQPDPHATACLKTGKWPDGRVAFEYWRERRALEKEKTARGKLERLLRMMSVFGERLFPRGEEPTYAEQVVRDALPPEMLDEFYSRLPAARAAAHAACPTN